MRVFLDTDSGRATITADTDDRPIRGGAWGSAESAFWGRVRDALRARGADVVRRRMAADGHMTADTQHYLRARCADWALYDEQYAIRDLVADYRDDGRVTVTIAGPAHVPPDLGWVRWLKRTEDPKLAWIERACARLRIPTARHGASWHAPLLWIHPADRDRADAILTRRFGRFTVDQIRDDHPRWMED